jgi:hypothetical protein
MSILPICAIENSPVEHQAMISIEERQLLALFGGARLLMAPMIHLLNAVVEPDASVALGRFSEIARGIDRFKVAGAIQSA